MSENAYFSQALDQLRSNLHVLADKSEETPEKVLKALAYLAAGTPLSMAAAAELELPPLDREARDRLQALIDKRLAGIPLAHLTGCQRFLGIDLFAGPEALIPRQETELLGQAAIALLNNQLAHLAQPLVVDVCTGAGNLAVALALAHPGASVFAADISPQAASLAKRNAGLHNLENRLTVLTGDLLSPFDSSAFRGKVDLLVCNPPYISSKKVKEMEREIAEHEPQQAFDGGPFGISILHRLIREAGAYLKPGGYLAFETGLGQGETLIKRLEKQYPHAVVEPVFDGQGNIRALTAAMPAQEIP